VAGGWWLVGKWLVGLVRFETGFRAFIGLILLGTFTGNPPYLVKKSRDSCRFSLKPIQFLKHQYKKSMGIWYSIIIPLVKVIGTEPQTNPRSSDGKNMEKHV